MKDIVLGFSSVKRHFRDSEKKWERAAGDAALRQPQRMAFSWTMRRLGPAQAVEKSATALNSRLRMHQKAATGALPWIERKS